MGTLIRRIPYGAPVPERTAQAPNGKLRLVYIGRLVERQKRISETTRALCRAVRQIPNVEGVIYGDGPARPAVEQILRAEAGTLPVRLGGRLDSDQVQDHLLRCHALVLLSDYEGLPIALMESMACGVVPICLRTRSGIPELLEDDVNGLLVNDRAADFVAAVRRLRREPGLWKQLSHAARAKIESEYSSQVGARQWAEFLWDLKCQAGSARSLMTPETLNLPPVHPDLAREDRRVPALPVQILQRLRWSARRIKRRLLDR
jgi:glycosyltransferase involved in cell wall biosynthesis